MKRKGSDKGIGIVSAASNADVLQLEANPPPCPELKRNLLFHHYRKDCPPE